MVAKIVSGVAVSSVIRAEIKSRVSKLAERGVTPGLAVGTDPASAVYVRNKIKACTEVGIPAPWLAVLCLAAGSAAWIAIVIFFGG
jgi:5,10-methylene-tetrahydrofolate dehydrogenase/methenyl tetrahydrofolate cyclohydrolase